MVSYLPKEALFLKMLHMYRREVIFILIVQDLTLMPQMFLVFMVTQIR